MRKISEETKRKISNTLKGHTVPKETREKISLKNKGKNIGNQYAKGNKPNKTSFKKGNIAPPTAFKKGHIPFSKNTKFSKERCEEMSKNPKTKGKRHWRWIKDRTKLKKYEGRNGFRDKECKRKVYERDNYKCKKNNPFCGGRIISHHILSWVKYPELQYDIDNCITLCQKHHKKFHKKYGYKNVTKKQLKDFLSESDLGGHTPPSSKL